MRNRPSKKTLGISARYLAAFFLLCGLCMNEAAQDVAVFPQYPTTTTPDGYINFIVAELK